MKLMIKNRKKLCRRLVIILAAVLLIGMASFTVFISPLLEKDQYIYIDSVVEHGDLLQGIMESGTIEYETSTLSYDLNLESVIADEEDEEEDEEEEEEVKYLEIEKVSCVAGQRVSTGDELMKFTDKSVASVRKLINTAVSEAAIELSEAKVEYEQEVLVAKNTYDVSMTNAKYANETRNLTNEKIQAQIYALSAEVAVLELEISQIDEDFFPDLQTSVDTARTIYENLKTAFEQGETENLYSYTQIETLYMNAKSAYEKALSNLEKEQENLENKQTQIESKREEIDSLNSELEKTSLSADQTYESDVLGGELAGEIYEFTLTSLEDTITTATQNLEELQAIQDAFEAFVGDGTIYATEDGMITEVNYSEGDDLVRTGNLLTYVTKEHYTVTIDVAQEDIPYLQIGDTVEVKLTAYDNETFSGTVDKISTTETSSSSTTVSYPVTIRMNEKTELLYSGMTADITFITDEADEVNYVSRKAIVEKNDKEYVYVKNSLGQMVLVEVETGFTDGVYIEIISGVEEGDVIYIASKISSESSENSLKDQSDTTTTIQKESSDNSDTYGTPEQMPDGMNLQDGMSMPDGIMIVPDGMIVPEGMGD